MSINASAFNQDPPSVVDQCAQQLELAENYLASGLISEAGELFEGMLNSANKAPALMGLARCSFHRERLHESLSYLQALDQVEPTFPDLANNMGVVLFKLGLVEQARQQFERAAAAAPQEPVSWLNLIDMARRTEDDDACRRYCHKLIEVDPGNTEARTILQQLDSGTPPTTP